MFLRSENGHIILQETWITAPLPSFANQLTLRLSEKIPTILEPTGTDELSPRTMWPMLLDDSWNIQSAVREAARQSAVRSAELLRAHISSFWNLNVNIEDQSTINWETPLGVNFKIYKVCSEGERVLCRYEVVETFSAPVRNCRCHCRT